MYSRSASGLSASEMPVKPRTSANRMVSSALFGYVVLVRILACAVDHLRRHVLAEAAGERRLERDSTK